MAYLAYAGIGSRETPPEIQEEMTQLAFDLTHKGWILRSGGAEGADKAFEHGVNKSLVINGHKSLHYPSEIYLPWPGFNNSSSALHPGNFPYTPDELDTAAHYHPAWDKCSLGAKKLHTRNVRQIFGCNAIHNPYPSLVKFVVCWTKGGQMVGGTSQALRMAQANNIPIFNYGTAQTTVEVNEMTAAIKQEAQKYQ